MYTHILTKNKDTQPFPRPIYLQKNIKIIWKSYYHSRSKLELVHKSQLFSFEGCQHFLNKSNESHQP